MTASFSTYCNVCGVANQPQTTLCFACDQALETSVEDTTLPSLAEPPASPALLAGRYRVVGMVGKVLTLASLGSGHIALARFWKNPAFKHEKLLRLAIMFGMSIAMFILMTHVAFAQANDNIPGIVRIKHSIMTIQELEQRGILTHAEAEKSIAYYIAQASKAAGRTLTLNEIMATPDPTPQKLTPLQEFAGAIDFLRVIMVLGIIAVVGAVAYLFRYYVEKLLRLFLSVPVVVYEMMFYAASLGCGIWGWLLPEPMHNYIGLLACLLFAGALGFSASYRRHLAHVSLFSILLFLVWAPAAILFGSSFIGFFAVGALLSALGFNILVRAVFESIRFRDTTVIGSATFAAFMVLALFIGLRLVGALIPALAVFEFGALFLGSFVGYWGLLISSSRWYGRDQRERYWGFQVVAIIAGIGALFFGSVFQIGELQKIGGTFFVLYCIAKILEIPTRSRPAFALLIAVVGTITICFCWFALTHQELFRQWLFLPS